MFNSYSFLDGMLAISGGTASSDALVSKGNAKAKPEDNSVRALLPSKANLLVKPTWHAPWKLYRVISGHTGWVRTVDVEPNNEWFATGGADRIIKVCLNFQSFISLFFRFGTWLAAN